MLGLGLPMSPWATPGGAPGFRVLPYSVELDSDHSLDLSLKEAQASDDDVGPMLRRRVTGDSGLVSMPTRGLRLHTIPATIEWETA